MGSLFTRRQTLCTVPLLFLSRSAAPCSAYQAIESSTVRQETVPQTCTLGFSTYGMKTIKTEQAIRSIASIGFDSIELTVWSGWDADPAVMKSHRRKSLRKQLDASNLKLTSLMEHVSPLDVKRQATALERLKLAAEFAHDLVPDKPPLIQTVLGSGQFEREKSKLCKRLGEWVDLAQSTKTTIAIKPHRGGVVSRPSEGVWLIKQLGEPKQLRMVYDYSHYAYRDLPINDTVDTALPFTGHVALKDAVRKGDRVDFRLPSRDSQIDFAKILRRFFSGGYRGDFNCEVSSAVWRQKDYEPITAAKQCFDVISDAFRQASDPRRSRPG